MNEKEVSLQERFMRIYSLFHRHRGQNHHGHGHMRNPYQGQGRVLLLLQMRPEISQKDLSYLLDMRPQSLGELLTKLEYSGYIARDSSESDRRVMNVRLTEKGLEAANQVERPSDSNEFFNCLSDEERVKLSEYLDRIITNMEQLCCGEQEDFDCKCHEGRGHGFGDRHHGHGGGHCHGRG